MTVRPTPFHPLGTLLSHNLISLSFAVLENPPPGQSTIYDLVANVTHESTAGTTRDKENTTWKVHVRAPPADDEGQERWLMMQDLIVEETAKELIFLGETVLQVRFRVLSVRVWWNSDLFASADLGASENMRLTLVSWGCCYITALLLYFTWYNVIHISSSDFPRRPPARMTPHLHSSQPPILSMIMPLPIRTPSQSSTIQRLVIAQRSQHPENNRHTRIELHTHEAGRDGVADVFKVHCRALDEDADGDDGVEGLGGHCGDFRRRGAAVAA